MISSDAFTEKMGISTTSVDSDEPGPFFGYREYLANTESLPHLKTAEDLLIDEALRRANGNQSLAARLLGMSRQALNNRLRRRRRKSSGSHERVQRTLT
jgi:DNA-binding NtrC family response regulator